MGLEIRPGLCAADSTSAATTDRTLAPGRDGRRNSRRQFYLWRAVDSEGEVLDFLVQSRRNARAAIRLMRKLLKKQGFAPATIVTDKLRSYGTAIRLLALSAQHEQGLRKNNRAEIHISRCDDESERCSGSNRPASRRRFPRRPCDRLQPLQRPTPSGLPPNTPPIPRRRDETVAACDDRCIISGVGAHKLVTRWLT